MKTIEQKESETQSKRSQLLDSISEIELEIKERYKEVQDFTASQGKYESFVKWKRIKDSELKSLKNKLTKL